MSAPLRQHFVSVVVRKRCAPQWWHCTNCSKKWIGWSTSAGVQHVIVSWITSSRKRASSSGRNDESSLSDEGSELPIQGCPPAPRNESSRKGLGSGRSAAFRGVRSIKRLAPTGTPAPNELDDSRMDLSAQGKLASKAGIPARSRECRTSPSASRASHQQRAACARLQAWTSRLLHTVRQATPCERLGAGDARRAWKPRR